MDKFIIKRNQDSPLACKAIQIRVCTYDAIKQMSADTGMSMVDLVEEMVQFCTKRLVVEEN